MYEPLFENLGLSPNEAKIYETLLHVGEASVSKISLKGKIHRRNVYDALNRLLEKGLVFEIIDRNEHTYEAVRPNKLLEIVKEKETQLKTALPQLNALYEKEEPAEAAYIYRGIEGFKNYMRDMARIGEETYFLSAKALWYSPGIDRSFLNTFIREMKRKKVSYKTLYDPRVPHKFPQALTEVGGEYKILPEGYATPGVMDVFGDHLVTFSSVDVANFGEDGMIFVIINQKLADSFRTWFDFMWKMCPEYKLSQ